MCTVNICPDKDRGSTANQSGEAIKSSKVMKIVYHKYMTVYKEEIITNF